MIILQVYLIISITIVVLSLLSYKLNKDPVLVKTFLLITLFSFIPFIQFLLLFFVITELSPKLTNFIESIWDRLLDSIDNFLDKESTQRFLNRKIF